MNGRDSNVRIVGIGASAGGIDALKDCFEAMPADSGMAFVVIQHLDPSRESYMAGLLAKHTSMAVVQAEDGMEIQANSVYTIPPNKFLFIKGGKLHLTEPVKRDGIRLPIDFFFRSLAQDQHEKAIAVLLSGSGSDGTLGVREIHGAGGIVLVQDPATAQFDAMLRNALATGLVDSVVPTAQIPATILEFVRQSDGQAANAAPETVQESVQSILATLGSQTKNDFQAYRKPTVWRRVQRRMGLNQMSDISDYARFLQQSPDEVGRLSKDMLIGVTSFFRDPEAFEELCAKVIAPMVKKKDSNAPLRAWTAGCSTGEEAYSVAILIREEMIRNKKSFPLQIFASDVDAGGLKCAREAIYPESIASDVSEERLVRFFIKKDNAYQVNKEIRESVIFAAHNLLVDPPFPKMDLISCRNLLIYIESESQKKLHAVFAFALNPGGYLFLGKSDSVEHNESFEAVSRNFKIYRRKEFATVPAGNFPTRAGLPLGLRSGIEKQQPSFRLSDLNQDVLLKHFDAAVVLIDERGNVLHFYGPSHKYLAHPMGDANLNLFELIEKKHSPKLRVAVDKAFRKNGTVTFEGLEFSRDDSTYAADVTISCCLESKAGTRLVAAIFQEVRHAVTASPVSAPGVGVSDHDVYIRQLEAENKSLKEELQSTTDGFQTAHEEFTAANEEVLAINEELQSTNEELETSKEELQSVNEELVTVNNQLNEKVVELGQTNDDLANFLNSSEVGTIFLDTHFCIRRFTPATTKLLNLLPLDLGRPVEHISNKFINVSLTAVADSVLKNLTQIEKDVQSSDGLWYLMRCLPYRTLGNKIDGVVFTFTDVTRLKASEETTMEARDYAENILHTTQEPLLVLDSELKVISANRAFYETFQVSPEETENRLIYELGDRQWDIPKLRELLEQILPTNSVIHDFEVTHDFPTIGPKIMSLNARRIYNRAKKDVRLILLGISDITERRLAEEVRAKLAAVVESSGDAIISKNLDGIITSWNAGAERLFGYRAEEMIGQPITRIIPADREEDETNILACLRRGERVENYETVRVGRDKQPIDISLTISPIRDPQGNIIGASKIARDITERKRIEYQRREFSRELEQKVFERTGELADANRALLQDMEERKKLEDQLRQVQKMESMGTLAAGIAHDLNNILNIIQGYTSVLGRSQKSDQIGESVAVITETTKRGAALVQQLLTLARKTETKLESINANTLIQRISNLLNETFPKNIELTQDLTPSLPSIMADPNLITQVLLNLCVNARDAMPDGGRLTLKTEEVLGKDLGDPGEVKAERYVCITVTDTGTGMDENVQSRIFEPFFTTKEIGQGTGLGLAVVYGIMKSHNGFIQVESKPMRGTTFRLYFPVVSSGG